jgi:hypothetical protein
MKFFTSCCIIILILITYDISLSGEHDVMDSFAHRGIIENPATLSAEKGERGLFENPPSIAGNNPRVKEWPLPEKPYEGYTLVSLYQSTVTNLIDNNKEIVHTWHGASAVASIAYLFQDGSIMRPCRAQRIWFQGGGLPGGRFQHIDWDNNILWDFTFSTYDYCQHHDIQPMPNGNILVIAWERKSRQEAIDAGRTNPLGEVWPTMIAEIEPVGTSEGNVVWEWHLWDHLIQDADPTKENYGVVADHPELLDINYLGSAYWGPEWIHANAIDYNPELDQIAFSSHFLHEFYIIDHSTTTEEAASHSGGNSGMGGDILYRWGNPQAYDRGSSDDQYFYVLHGINWIVEGMPGEGNLLVFNNGDGRPGPDYSTVDEIVPPVDGWVYTIEPGEAFGPETPLWTYKDPDNFFSAHLSGAFRLPNGNTLITEGWNSYVFEVTRWDTIVWDYHTGGMLSRVFRYPIDYLE